MSYTRVLFSILTVLMASTIGASSEPLRKELTTAAQDWFGTHTPRYVIQNATPSPVSYNVQDNCFTLSTDFWSTFNKPDVSSDLCKFALYRFLKAPVYTTSNVDRSLQVIARAARGGCFSLGIGLALATGSLGLFTSAAGSSASTLLAGVLSVVLPVACALPPCVCACAAGATDRLIEARVTRNEDIYAYEECSEYMTVELFDQFLMLLGTPSRERVARVAAVREHIERQTSLGNARYQSV